MSETAPLLHNIGGPPMAFIRWNGLAATAPAAGADASAAVGAGCWLHCRHQRASVDAVDWNRCTALLELVRPRHGLAEPQARSLLLELMEARLSALEWPPVLVCSIDDFPGVHPNEALVLDHPLTVFVALGKCIGSLWMRDRPWRLAPLCTPTVVQAGGIGQGRAAGRPAAAGQGDASGAQWSCRLWFPQGLPAQMLQRVRAADRRKEKQ